MKILNLLASTSRQWNCGDEFILFGIKNLFKEIGHVNWSIYNRNPDSLAIGNTGKSNVWTNQSLKNIDKVIIAGTPEWFGAPLSKLFSQVVVNNKETIFLGIGYISPSIATSDLDKQVLKKASLIVTRDDNVRQYCDNNGLVSHSLPCPCIFASEEIVIKQDLKKIVVVYQSDKTVNQSINCNLKLDLCRLIDKLNAEVICHYTDEYFESIDHFKSVHYSFDARDYIDYYKSFDLVISTRLHGAILAASCGTPAILLHAGGNSRLEGCISRFPIIKYMQCNETLKFLEQHINIRDWSLECINFKDIWKIKYLNVLKPLFTLGV